VHSQEHEVTEELFIKKRQLKIEECGSKRDSRESRRRNEISWKTCA
jgi:hypothetical protein